MTRSKLDLANTLVSLRKDGSDPEKLAKEMTLRRLCFEIEKIESEISQKPKKEKKPFWSFTANDSDEE